jgi:hypothetical protein
MATRLEEKGQRAARPASRACAPVPVTPTVSPTTRAKGNVANDVPRAPRSSGHVTVDVVVGPGSSVVGTETLTSAVSCGSGSGKEDPSARARGENNGSHPRASGPVPNCRCNLSWVSIPESILSGWQNDGIVQCPSCKRFNPERVYNYLNRGTVPERYTSIAQAISGEDPVPRYTCYKPGCPSNHPSKWELCLGDPCVP